MRQSRFTEEQIIGILQEVEAGAEARAACHPVAPALSPGGKLLQPASSADLHAAVLPAPTVEGLLGDPLAPASGLPGAFSVAGIQTGHGLVIRAAWRTAPYTGWRGAAFGAVSSRLGEARATLLER